MKYFLIAILFYTQSIYAESFSVGSQLPAFSLNDQFGNGHTLTSDIKLIFFSAQRSISAKINKFLEKKGLNYLARHKAIYVADISPMPSIITEYFALPKMRKFHYPMLLDYERVTTKDFPREKGYITVMKLDGMKIKDLEFVKTHRELDQFINQ